MSAKRYCIKLKCPNCKQVKRRLYSYDLLDHKQTKNCPDCNTEMYSYESNVGSRSDFKDRPGLNPNYFEELKIKHYVSKDH